MLLLWGVVAIVAFQFMLGLYAVALNALFYTQYGPFYDLVILRQRARENAARCAK